MDNAVVDSGGEATQIGSFEIVRKLARGGMAELFLAVTRGPPGFENLVVLKRVLPRYAGRPRFVQQFLEEAKLAASLAHPNIVQVYDIGIVDGSYFFTMEYLHGQDVRSILHRTWRTGEKFAIEHAVQIARQVAAALHFAHEKRHANGSLLGIVHRDVSPSNIIVTYDGAAKLLDFGVAKTTASTVKTRTGALKGKISYMSPEQARGAPLDRRSDVFSLGIVLWEMVTTQRLFRADNDLATLQQIIHQPPRPPDQVRPDCPPQLARIVLRALAQDPAERYQTAEELMSELDQLVRNYQLEQSPSALSVAMEQLFLPEVTAWRDARAAGVPLADHLHEIGDLTAPVSESDFIEVDASVEDGDEPDEIDDLEDADDEKTEHMPVLIDPPGSEAEPANEMTTQMPAAMTRDMIAAMTADQPTQMRTERATPPPVPLASHPDTTPGVPFAVIAGAVALPPELRPSARHATPGAPFAPHGPGPFPTGRSPTVSSAPFAAPPWQSGQPPGGSPGDRVARSWAIVDLPAFDPAVFERQRRFVLRVAAGLVAAVFLLAIIAGRC